MNHIEKILKMTAYGMQDKKEYEKIIKNINESRKKQKPIREINLYKQENESLIIKFDTNGGYNIPPPVIFKDYNDNQNIPNIIPVKKGYKFIGWNINKQYTKHRLAPSSTYYSVEKFKAKDGSLPYSCYMANQNFYLKFFHIYEIPDDRTITLYALWEKIEENPELKIKYNGEPINGKVFMKTTDKNKIKGIFLILMFNEKPNSSFMNYTKSYIGNSDDLITSVLLHLKGEGNGNIYDDIKCGRIPYVALLECSDTIINDKEEEYARKYNAKILFTNGKTDSINEFIMHDDFLKKEFYSDYSGCYVILIFNKVPNAEFSNYCDVYCGQSQTVLHRVKKHLSGYGNGNIFADIKYGKKAFIKILPCKLEQMNDLEKYLIEKYNATKSYNKTKGGSADRTKF